MINFRNVYLSSIEKILKNPFFYFISVGGILASFLVAIVIPAISVIGISAYYESSAWTHIVFAAYIVIIAIISAVFGGMNAINNEKIYLLSKPIKRSTFLFAKCLSSLTLAIVISFICSLILLCVALVEWTKKHEIVFQTKNGNNAASIFISFTMICCYGTICSTIWSYVFKQGYSVILSICLVLIYAVAFPLIYNGAIDRSDLGDLFRLLFVTLPIGIYLFLTIIFSSIGSWIFMKSEVES